MRRLIFLCALAMSGCSLIPRVAQDTASADEAIAALREVPVVQAEAVEVAVTAEAEAVFEPGPRFDLAVDEMDAVTFFSGLVTDTPFSMVVHPDVNGVITLRLSGVTVDEVMQAVRDVYGYDFKLDGTVYRVFPDALRTEIFDLNYLNVARVGQSEIQVSAGKVSDSNDRSGTQDVYSDTGSGSDQVVGTIVNTNAQANLWAEVETTLKNLSALDAGSHVMVTPQVGLVVVKARPATLRSVREYVARVEASLRRQVVLEAKIVEVTLSEGFQAGIDWHSFGDTSRGVFNPIETVNPDGSISVSGGSEHSVAGEFISGSQEGFNPLGAAFSLYASSGDFTATLDLLSTQGAVQVLSSPRIATVNNQKAVIKVGSDEFFVTDISSNTVTAGSAINTNDSPELTPFFSGIALDVTPQINSEGEVILHVHPTVSEVTEQRKEIGGEIVPLAASTIRESDSIVRARSGQIVVIGGLMQNSSTDQNAQVPWLSRLPLIGHLFRQKNRSSIKSELVILLRPVVVDDRYPQQLLSRSADNAAAIRNAMR